MKKILVALLISTLSITTFVACGNKESSNKVCAICNKAIVGNDFVTANKGTTIICKKCLLRM